MALRLFQWQTSAMLERGLGGVQCARSSYQTSRCIPSNKNKLPRRLYSNTVSNNNNNGGLELSYDLHEPPERKQVTDAQAVVLCHGLFGSKQNWRSIARAIAKRLGVRVFALDLRNHGRSPHANSMRYDEMAIDLERFFKTHSIKQAALVGHSMGGKAVQAMALSKNVPSDFIRYLISVDMTPARGPLSNEFQQYVEAMIQIEESSCTSRKEADEILSKVEPAEGIRQFLLTNMTQDEQTQHWHFRIPVRTIQTCLYQIGDFPYNDSQGLIAPRNQQVEPFSQPDATPPPQTAQWDGEALFVKGAKSKYINRRNIPICNAFFPNAQHVTLDTGHWVQAERPTEFVDELVRFVEQKPKE